VKVSYPAKVWISFRKQSLERSVKLIYLNNPLLLVYPNKPPLSIITHPLQSTQLPA
jgi:hypothetical protein